MTSLSGVTRNRGDPPAKIIQKPIIIIVIIIKLYRTLDSPVKDDTSTVSDISQMYIHVCLRQQSYTHVKHDEFSNTTVQFTTLEITIQ